jgi:hypothetical protein
VPKGVRSEPFVGVFPLISGRMASRACHFSAFVIDLSQDQGVALSEPRTECPHPVALVDSHVTPLPVVNSGPIQKWTVAIAFPASPLADHSTPYTAFPVPSLIMIRFVRFQANRSSKPRFSQPLHFRVRSLSAGGLRPKPTLYEHTKILRCSEPEMPLSKEISRRSVT